MTADVLTEKLKNIKMLILDVDGVLAAGIIMGDDGSEFKSFCGQDGSGIKYWRRSGHKVAIITGRESGCVARRRR